VENELIVVEELNAIDVFSKGGVDEILQKIKEQVASVVPDVETIKGRKEIASIAHKVARSKTALDDLGKSLVAERKKEIKKVDDERKKARDFLDELKAEVRQPLTDWEETEEKRIQAHKDNIEETVQAGEYSKTHWMELSYNTMRDRLMEIEAMVIDSKWEEFEQEAREAKEIAIVQIRGAMEMRKNYDREQTELEELRALKAEQEKAAEEERLRKEGEERARAAAEAARKQAEAETARAEAAAEAARQAQKRAEKEAAEAAERAREEERQRQAETARKEKEAAEAREADKKHRGKINKAAKDSLVALGIEDHYAKAIVEAIARGAIPNVSIKY